MNPLCVYVCPLCFRFPSHVGHRRASGSSPSRTAGSPQLSACSVRVQYIIDIYQSPSPSSFCPPPFPWAPCVGSLCLHMLSVYVAVCCKRGWRVKGKRWSPQDVLVSGHSLDMKSRLCGVASSPGSSPSSRVSFNYQVNTVQQVLSESPLGTRTLWAYWAVADGRSRKCGQLSPESSFLHCICYFSRWSPTSYLLANILFIPRLQIIASSKDWVSCLNVSDL